MIPKKGEIVDINPIFKKAWLGFHGNYATFGERKDGHIHVIDVSYKNYGYLVITSNTGGHYKITPNGGAIFTDMCQLKENGYDQSMPLFLSPEPDICTCSEPSIIQRELLGQVLTFCKNCKKPPK